MAVDDGGERGGQVGQRIEDIELAGLCRPAVGFRAELSRFWSEPFGLDQRGAPN